jgi:hypothetical protein
LVEVSLGSLCWHQVFGAAVFAFKHGVNHAQLTQLIEAMLFNPMASVTVKGFSWP